ncbi:beta-L-arabinofuranosidase domain-containing protein [Coraliomargarita parva]|uniref:beta-L-arabinofuranosidase domain-containing protein n=1 Tax=Coraliomargarita parva TaxID=3014050 RepID=UPI0022B315F9|nr:beta-L-arabinofuranosidase domain-containing protein [Coraliomargarita parva]
MWKEDFEEGLPGRLDVINQDVTKELFAAQCCPIVHDGEKPTWWPGEQEAYWHESFIHAAFQVGNPSAVKRITEYVERILLSQSEDGYLGIYDPDSRFLSREDPRYGDKGGEFHTQAHLFLALIAFHEHTKREDVLVAVEKAAQLTIRHYPKGPFGITGEQASIACGNGHSITFIDAMMQLYRLTGNECYLRYVAVMYECYLEYPQRNLDLGRKILEDPIARFVAHGVHTAESFHLPSALKVAGVSGANRLAASAMQKLQWHLTPGGALVSNEMIEERLGNGHALYEYCGQAELIKSLAWIAQYESDTHAAELAARLYLNASLGARLHPLGALQYLSCDDRLEIPDLPQAGAIKEIGLSKHFQLSSIVRPTCCTASSGRPVHYYLSSGWMKQPSGDALALMNFMPCVLETEMDGTELKIEEQTDYPFSDSVRLSVTVSEPKHIPIAVRIPSDGALVVADLPGMETEVKDGLLWLRKVWQSGDVVEISIKFPVKLEKTQDGSAYYLRRGPLTFGLPFETQVSKVSENPNWRNGEASGLYEYAVDVADASKWGSRIDPSETFEVVRLPGDLQHPWTNPVIGLRGKLIDDKGKAFEVTLVPLAAAISRRVTFLDISHAASEAAQTSEDHDVTIGY